jgi:hypothetical protein
MSLQQAYARLLPASGLRMVELVTYLFLRRMGYTVLRTTARGETSVLCSISRLAHVSITIQLTLPFLSIGSRFM